MQDRLSPLQREILEGFFELAPDFFLTGGAALAGFHLGHRTTEDLDFFVHEAKLDEGVSALRRVAERLGGSLESLSQLAWVLSQIQFGDDASSPGGGTVPELRSYQEGLLARLERLALPE